MRARLKQDYRWKTARLCGGVEFVKHEYRAVPAGREDEARAAEIIEIEPDEAQPAEMVMPHAKRGRKDKE